MFGKWYLLPYLVVSLISARVPLISTRVSAHCQAILFHYSVIHQKGKLSQFVQVDMLVGPAHKILHLEGDLVSTGAHFTNNFSITIQMWWKFHFALIQVLIQWSLQNLAHGTTAGLSWHVPNFVAMWSSVIELELNEISITFELWWKNR